MIPVTYIRRNVAAINFKYRSAKRPLHFLLYAKLAIIEVGGWVEMSMDDLVVRCGRGLTETVNQNYLNDTIIDKTWGFDYKTNFRQMLMRAIGLVALERLEATFDAAKHARMIAAIAALKTARNNVAHTYVKSLHPTAPIPAPAVTAGYLNDIYVGLKDIESSMRKQKLI